MVSAEVKSIFVKNIPSTVPADEIKEVFKKFRELKPDGVTIRNPKDIGVCYAFVEFKDITGVQNAIQASTVELAGQQVVIEERRVNRSYAPRGGRIARSRRRGGYHFESSKGRYYAPRNFGRGNGKEGYRDYNSQGFQGIRVPKNGVQNESE